MVQISRPPTFYMKIFKYTEKLKEWYSEHPYTHHLGSGINILLYSLYHVAIMVYPHVINSHPYN